MPRPPRSSSAAQPRRRRTRAATSAELSLEHLERRFARFRREHPPQTRIPETLRGAVLAALRQGVTPSQLRRCCRLSSQQLEQWKRSRRKPAVDAGLAGQVPRVFSVVDDRPAGDREPVRGDDADALELRVGDWSISVRRVGR